MITCRGKNGWFNLHKVDAYAYPKEDGTGYVSISSKKPYRDVAPIYLQGPTSEIVALLGSIKAQIEGEPCGMFELRSAEKPTGTKCSGGTNPELCAFCHFNKEEEVLING
ncbi:MAG: hypothetical protein ACYDIC_16715 [Desulfobaccales bacterium]